MKSLFLKNAWLGAKPFFRNLPIVALFLSWLLPVLYYALTDVPAPWLPQIFQQRTNVSRLFSSESSTWAIYAIEYRLRSKQYYRGVTEGAYFVMKPFGRRTRLQRILATADKSQQERLCGWVRDRLHVSLNEPIASVRILVFPYEVSTPRLKRGYTQPLPVNADPATIQEVSRFDFSEQ